jgi:NADPH:quinone reductase-like Zn-dependent oxidoreductase
MAERFPFPRAGLVPLPPHIRDFDAISALPLASALRMAGRVPLPGRVLVVSDSGLGIVAACALRGRRQLIFLSMPAEEAVESVRKFSLHRDPGGRFPLVVAACDGPDVFARALDRVTPQGTLAVLGMPECTGPVLSLVGRELTVVGIDEGDVSEALTQLEDKESCEILSRARPTIFPLGQADQALAHATRPGSLRVILDNLA